MAISAYAILLVSTATHALWNFLLKRSGGGQLVVGLSKISEVVIFAPAFIVIAAPHLGALRASWLLVVVGAALVLVNYAALGRAYASGDLSIVYPISRGAVLFFLPLLGYFAFGERLSPLGWTAIVLIVAGIGLLQLKALTRAALAELVPALGSRATVYSLLAGLAAAAYTVWDKRAVNQLPIFVYFFAYTALVAGFYALVLFRTSPPTVIASAWRTHRWTIVSVGILNTVTYLLVLVALREEHSTYVIALRQLSIAWGVLLGALVLREGLSVPKRVGTVVLIAGCLLAAVSP